MMEMIFQEIRRLIGLNGNCGRVIARFMGRVLTPVPDGHALIHRIPVGEHGNVWLAVMVAYFRDRVAHTCGWIKWPGMRCVVEGDLRHRELVFKVVVDTVPNGVRARQEMLKSFHDTMDRLMGGLHVLEEENAGPLQVRLLGALAFQRAGVAFEVFEELITGRFARLDECPPALVRLANVLNPEVAMLFPDGADLSTPMRAWEELDAVWDPGFASDMSSLRQGAAVNAARGVA